MAIIRTMTTAPHDTLQRFLFEDKGIRGQIVHLRASYNAILEHHPYPIAIKYLLGKALCASSLLSSNLKFEGSLILQTQGNGPIDYLVAQCTHELHLRGLAKWQADSDLENMDNPLGSGQLAITLIPDHKSEQRYQGVVDISHGDLATSLQHYFAQSEQLATKIWLFADEHHAAGLLLQQMPEDDNVEENYWEHVYHLANTLKAEELLTLSNEAILHRLFHEEDIRLFNPTPVCFRCKCSLGKMEQAIITMGEIEANDLLKTHKTISVNCEFCNKHYEFDKVDVEALFKQ